jgi:hypothetical protein
VIDKLTTYIKYIVIGLIVVLVVLAIFIVRDYRLLRREQIVGDRESFIAALLEHHGPLTVNDVNIVSAWMTFDYINKIFALPGTYLKAQLQITDSRYPKLSLSSYARSEHDSSLDVTTQVQSAIRNYLMQNSTST